MSCCDGVVQTLNKLCNSKFEPNREPGEPMVPGGWTLGTAVDHEATLEAAQLFQNLMTKLGNRVMFGHEDTTAYGVHWQGSVYDASKSDIYGTCGDFPAVYGWDLGATGGLGDKNLDGVPYALIKQHIKHAYARGGVNTISMHLDNPVTKIQKSAWDQTPAVKHVLPGGSLHDDFLKTLDGVAAFLKDLKADDGTLIPIILRPYHEHNHEWSWWGKSACSDAQFKALWKMTVRHFRDTHNIHHVLYAISPQDCDTEAKYLERYVGDQWVDVLGFDWYMLQPDGSWEWLGKSLSMLGKLGAKKQKPVALTEVGFGMRVPCQDWWTQHLLKALTYNSNSCRVAWCLVWRNLDEDCHFAPYPRGFSASDFQAFRQHQATVFNTDVQAMRMYE